MEIILLIIGFVLGWIVHSILSFKKFGKELNQLKKEKWNNTPREERIKIRLAELKKNLPKIPVEHLVSIVCSNDSEEFTEDEKLYEKAKKVAEKVKFVSSAILMEKLSIGYTRSAAMMDLLEERAIIDSEGNLMN